MTVVLDAPAAVALVVPERDRDGTVARLFDSHTCYMTEVAVIQMYCSLFDTEGRDTALHWLQFVATARDIRIAEADHSPDFIESAAEATLAAGQLPTGTSAALAHKLRVPLVTNVADVQGLADRGFCQVIFF